MINADEALRIILDAVQKAKKEKVRWDRAGGRTLAEEIVAPTDLPPFPNSSMDGFAVRRSDLAIASPEHPVSITVVGESSAGTPFRAPLPPASAVRITTGGRLPDGADAVVPVEQARASGRRKVRFEHVPTPYDHVRLPGEDIAAGERVMSAGELLTPAHLGVLASLGATKVRVFSRPTVAIAATGDELVQRGEVPRKGQIRNSTSCVLTGLVEEAGGTPLFLGIARDRKKRIKGVIREGLGEDILLVTGGVSVGKYDLVHDVLEDLGVAIKFWTVNVKPGKPLLFGVHEKTLVFGLPGNPVSTAVTFLQFVRPALLQMLGRGDLHLPRVTAVSDERIVKNDGKRYFLRGIVREEAGAFRVKSTGSQSTGVMSSMVKANCLIILPEETGEIRPGDTVTIELLRPTW